MKKKIILTVVAVVLLFTLSACNGKEKVSSVSPKPTITENAETSKTLAPSESSEITTTKTITDQAGRTIEIPIDIKTIAIANLPPLAPVFCQFMGSETSDYLVGIPPNSIPSNSISLKILPKLSEIKSDYYAAGEINVEQLGLLKADVIFAAVDTEHLKVLENAGFTVVAFDSQEGGVDSLATISSWHKLFGEIFSMESKATDIDKYNNEIYNLVTSKLKDISDENKAKVLHLPWYNGDPASFWTSPTGFAGQYYSETTGAINLGADASPSASLTIEEVAKLNPDIIYLGSFIGSLNAEQFYIDENVTKYFSDLGAIKNKSVYQLPGGFSNWFMPTADSALSLLYQAKLNHQDLFSDVNIQNYVKEFYQKFYSVELSQDELDSMIRTR